MLMVFLSLSVLAGADEDAQECILKLAREGSNLEVIALYEKLADSDSLPVDVLRATAGSYWRERRFAEARQLYKRIMDRQPNLQSLGDGRQGKVPPAGDAEAVATGGEAVVESPADAVPAPVPDEPAAPVAADAGQAVPAPEVPAPAAVPADGALPNELESLKAAYRELETSRDAQRRETEARIAGLMVMAEARSVEMDALRQQLSVEVGKVVQTDTALLQARQQLQSQVAVLGERIGVLGREASSAREAYETLRASSDRKINDLLDANKAEKNRSDASDQRMAAREAELLARIEEMRTAGEASRLQITSLEQTLEELRDRFKDVSARLAEVVSEMHERVDRVDDSSLALALQEVELLEREYTQLESETAARQAELQAQIRRLEEDAAGAAGVLAETVRERDAERERRVGLEQQQSAQTRELSEAKAQLDEAKAALARQYDVIRAQLQGGVSMRLEGVDTPGTAAGETVRLAPDLVPMIGQLEDAAARASVEVQQLRVLLEYERAAFAAATAKNESALAAMTAAHELRAAGLKGEIQRLEAALAARDRLVAMLESDLATEREASERVLVMARDAEAALSARIQALEAAVASPVE